MPVRILYAIRARMMIMNDFRRYGPRPLLFLLALSVVTLPARSQSLWDFVPEVSMGVENQDNVLLLPGDGNGDVGSASRAVVNVGATLTNASERGRIFIQPRVRSDTYMQSDADINDGQDYFFRAGGQYRWQTVATSFQTDYSRQSVLRSEFAEALPGEFDPDDPDFEDPEDIDSGRLDFFNEFRERLIIRGNLDFSLSPRNLFRFEARHSDNSYTRPAGALTTRSDSDNTTLAMTIRRRVDQRNQVSARMFATQFTSGRLRNTTDTVGVEGSLNRSLTQIWRMDLAVGVERSDYEFLRVTIDERVDNADTNVTFRLRFSQRAERSSMNVSLQRLVNPNSNGFMVVREEFRAYRRHSFRPRLEGQFGVRLSKLRTVGDANRPDDREYGRLELGLAWAMRERVFLEGGYDLRAQRFVREDTRRASSNMIYLGIGYRGLSRL
jgi:hypothetical protein